jgi:hypothetical protein
MTAIQRLRPEWDISERPVKIIGVEIKHEKQPLVTTNPTTSFYRLFYRRSNNPNIRLPIRGRGLQNHFAGNCSEWLGLVCWRRS